MRYIKFLRELKERKKRRRRKTYAREASHVFLIINEGGRNQSSTDFFMTERVIMKSIQKNSMGIKYEQ